MRDLTLITYNLWHGLSGEGTLRFGELEPEQHRLEREQAQEQYFSHQHADIYFFQETNPLDVRMARFSKILNAAADGQIDSSGVRLETAGLPLNLYSGLTTYTSSQLQSIHYKSLKLSGSSIQNEWFSIQLKESRYALFTECLHPVLGRILLVNLHLHHGLERTRALSLRVLEWKRKFNPSARAVADIDSKLNSGDRRRKSEIECLLKNLSALKSRYPIIVMAGDFNASPDSEIHELIRGFGFEDLWEKAGGGAREGGSHAKTKTAGEEAQHHANGFTYDGQRNVNHRFNAKFKLPEDWDAIDAPLLAKDEFRKIIMDQEAQPRRIDYLYVKSSAMPVHVKSMEVLGPHVHSAQGAASSKVNPSVRADIETSVGVEPSNDRGIELSDHFGLKAKIHFGL